GPDSVELPDNDDVTYHHHAIEPGDAHIRVAGVAQRPVEGDIVSQDRAQPGEVAALPRVEVGGRDVGDGIRHLTPLPPASAWRRTSSGCRAGRPVPCAICCRQETPVAAMIVSSGSARMAGKSRSSPMLMDSS